MFSHFGSVFLITKRTVSIYVAQTFLRVAATDWILPPYRNPMYGIFNSITDRYSNRNREVRRVLDEYESDEVGDPEESARRRFMETVPVVDARMDK